MELPIYELRITEKGSEVDFVALVDMPAIQKDFLVFKDKQRFEIVSEDQRIISGPLMIAEQLIYRNSEAFGEHYVRFTAPTIRDIAIKFAKNGYQKNVNIMHEESMQVQGCTLFESFITDSTRGILPMKGFEDTPNGSWFGSMFVECDATWALVKEGKARGFSVEGMFDYIQPTMNAETLLRKISQLLNTPISE